MFHAEAEDGCRVIVANFLLLGVEADPLADDGGFGAGRAPYGEGHLKAYSENTLTGLAGAVPKGMSAVSWYG